MRSSGYRSIEIAVELLKLRKDRSWIFSSSSSSSSFSLRVQKEKDRYRDRNVRCGTQRRNGVTA